MEQASTLGAFNSLPRELRDEIWQHVMATRRFAFLRASRPIYTDASSILDRTIYTYTVLQFHISPEYQYKSWLTVESNFEAIWPLRNLNHAFKKGFNKVPYEKLKKIQINIQAPSSRDSGQVICLYKKCRDLAALLEHAKQGLPNLEINLLDSESAKWSLDGEPQRSIDDEFWNDTDDQDIVLYAFLRLRNARSATINTPTHCNDCFSRRVAKILMRKDLVGTYRDPDDEWDDLALQEQMDELYVRLDLDLDSLPGPTANMMRLERFSSWYTGKIGGESKYEKEYERIFKTWPDFAFIPSMIAGLHIRYLDMRAFNPKSLKHRYEEGELSAILAQLPLPAGVKRLTKAFDLGLIKETWEQDTWHNRKGRRSWPEGIPPLQSREYKWKYLVGLDEEVSPMYEDEWEKKLKSWSSEENGTLPS
ncbi:MAG: hypothetical protein Q9166_007408 [cf. Caloplaca sp. 2 TL-2023]